MEFDIDLMIPDKRLSISEGAIQVMGWQSCTDKSSFTYAILKALTEEYHFSLDTPFREYPDEIKDVLINGTHGKELKVRYKGQRGEGVHEYLSGLSSFRRLQLHLFYSGSYWREPGLLPKFSIAVCIVELMPRALRSE